MFLINIIFYIIKAFFVNFITTREIVTYLIRIIKHLMLLRAKIQENKMQKRRKRREWKENRIHDLAFKDMYS